MANTKIPSELIDGTLGVAGISSSANTTAITINSSEQVGIGTTSPTKGNLVVSGASYDSQLLIERTDTSSRWGLGGTTSGAFQIWDDNQGDATRFVMNSSGNVGIGTSSPTSLLHLSAATPSIQLTDSDNNADAYIQGTDGNLRFFADDSQEASSSIITFAVDGSERMRITSTGIVETGTSTSDVGGNIRNWTTRNWLGLTGDLPNYTDGDYPVLKTPYDYMYISVNGAYSAYIQGNGTYTANSDERLKTNITDLPSGQLDKVTNLRGVNFKWLDTNRGEGQQMGVIAQEIEAEYPELVTEGVEDIKGVNYAGLVVPLIEAIKELKTKLEAAEARITELEG